MYIVRILCQDGAFDYQIESPEEACSMAKKAMEDGLLEILANDAGFVLHRVMAARVYGSGTYRVSRFWEGTGFDPIRHRTEGGL